MTRRYQFYSAIEIIIIIRYLLRITFLFSLDTPPPSFHGAENESPPNLALSPRKTLSHILSKILARHSFLE